MAKADFQIYITKQLGVYMGKSIGYPHLTHMANSIEEITTRLKTEILAELSKGNKPLSGLSATMEIITITSDDIAQCKTRK